ncbi:hypothetical protein P9869_35815 [Streptomyces ossamyceticus]|nr:hypothetical protein [Streptomyces ossamyceticus]
MLPQRAELVRGEQARAFYRPPGFGSLFVSSGWFGELSQSGGDDLVSRVCGVPEGGPRVPEAVHAEGTNGEVGHRGVDGLGTLGEDVRPLDADDGQGPADIERHSLLSVYEVVLDGVVALGEQERGLSGLLDSDDEFDGGVASCLSADLVVGGAGGELGGVAGRACLPESDEESGRDAQDCGCGGYLG